MFAPSVQNTLLLASFVFLFVFRPGESIEPQMWAPPAVLTCSFFSFPSDPTAPSILNILPLFLLLNF